MEKIIQKLIFEHYQVHKKEKKNIDININIALRVFIIR